MDNLVKLEGNELTALQIEKIRQLLASLPVEKAWQIISKEILNSNISFKTHLAFFDLCYPNWREHPNLAAAWIPTQESIEAMQLSAIMRAVGAKTRAEFHTWTTAHVAEFWQRMIDKLGIRFTHSPNTICDLSNGVDHPQWLAGATFNIADSCFQAPPQNIAIISQKSKGQLNKMTYAELNALSNRVANSLVAQGFTAGDTIGIDMTMTAEAVAIYLGIIKMGGAVISIADSFSSDEIATRLQIAKAKAIFTHDFILRGEKKIPLYARVQMTKVRAIVVPSADTLECEIAASDLSWQAFLVANDQFTSVSCKPTTYCNILFSSGTTGTPKAIPWTHTTPIKAAGDAYLHHNINTTDCVAWPTNLGWMMGPWLVFATLINQACIALYEDMPTTREFGRFIQDAGVTVLGVIPTLVATWRQSQCMQGLDWGRIRVFSSTGECSNPEDMLYLMSLAGYKPIIEYCGGTEIGGAYVSSTLIENNYPSVFTTPTMGLNFVLLDEQGKLTNNGEVALIPPSIGLSNELLNLDHQKVYFTGMPKTPEGKVLRRHGDQLLRFADGKFCVLGRVDDTMNLGGIKTSSAEIERTLVGLDNIIETAAIAITPEQHGPSQLVVYAATQMDLDKDVVKKAMQMRISQQLNPLFKIHDVVFVKELPKTASNKIMRRVLRDGYRKF